MNDMRLYNLGFPSSSSKTMNELISRIFQDVVGAGGCAPRAGGSERRVTHAIGSRSDALSVVSAGGCALMELQTHESGLRACSSELHPLASMYRSAL